MGDVDGLRMRGREDEAPFLGPRGRGGNNNRVRARTGEKEKERGGENIRSRETLVLHRGRWKS